MRPRLRLSQHLLATLTLLLLAGWTAAAASASPRDAELSGLSCRACHTVGAHLNGIGQAWAAASNRLEPIGNIPLISVKTSAAYVSDGNDGGLPKAIVNYLDLYLNGKIASNVSYVVQQHVIDGGTPGLNREAFVQWRRPRSRWFAGAMALPLLTDPERFRELDEDYLPAIQTVGNNPFALVESHPMAGGFAGSQLQGLEVGTFAVAGHEAGSGVPQTGTDAMIVATQRMPGLALSALRYDGTRLLGATHDRFWRLAYGAVADRGPWRLDLAFSHGHDGDPGIGQAVNSSGGMAQLLVDVNAQTFVQGRYEGVADTSGAFVRRAVIGFGRRIAANTRLTVEDGIGHDARTHNELHVVAAFGACNARVASGSY